MWWRFWARLIAGLTDCWKITSIMILFSESFVINIRMKFSPFHCKICPYQHQQCLHSWACSAWCQWAVHVAGLKIQGSMLAGLCNVHPEWFLCCGGTLKRSHPSSKVAFGCSLGSCLLRPGGHKPKPVASEQNLCWGLWHLSLGVSYLLDRLSSESGYSACCQVN